MSTRRIKCALSFVLDPLTKEIYCVELCFTVPKEVPETYIFDGEENASSIREAREVNYQR